MSELSDIFRILVSPQRRAFFLFLFLAVVLTISRAPLPYLTGYLIDVVLPAGNVQHLVLIVIVLAVLYAVFSLVFYANAWFKLRVKRAIMIDLHQRALSGILGMSYNRRLQMHNGDLVSRLTRDITQLNAVMPYGWSNLLHMLLLSAALLIVVFVLNWQLSSILVLLVPVAVFIYMRFDDALWSSSVAESDASARKLSAIQETVQADTEVKAYDAKEFFVEYCQEVVRDFENKSLIRELYDAKVNILIMVIPMIAIVLIWYLGGMQVMSEQMSIGLIVTYTATLALLVPALVEIIDFASSYPNEVIALQRVKELFPVPEADSDNAIASVPLPAESTKKTKTVESPESVDALISKQLTFSYLVEEPLFDKLNLRFERGKAYLLNGGNGSGKSTLLTLLSGSLIPDSGSVLLDDKNLGKTNGTAKLVTYVPQTIRIISDSVRNNVALGSAIETGQIEQALQTIGLGDWLGGLEHGIDHVLKNAQSSLSGGQIQKIGLARALLRNTPVLLLDEPTNNLDSDAVNHLIGLIKTHKKNKIVVIVSHDDRIRSSVDHVLYLERSRIGEATGVYEKS